MEQVASQPSNPHLQRVLKSYQTSAMRSLQGPGPFQALQLAEMAKLNASDISVSDDYRKVKGLSPDKGVDFLAPPPFPIQQMPVFTTVDASRSDKMDTILEGETIACFVVGGEKRLCLPQILNTVLRDFSLQQINTVCDELHIFCSRCNPEQLDLLKVTGILPLNAPSCGLITKTDAERLCNALLHCSPEKSSEYRLSPNCFKVYHECFGKCKGIFNPEMYTSSSAKCIRCVDCGGLFCPQKFVRHSHKALENRTCHWGFDSSNWRSYILLAQDQDAKDKLKDVLDTMKSRFDVGNKYKRKQIVDIDGIDIKRTKAEEHGVDISQWTESTIASLRGSAFQPWSPSVLNALKEGKLLPAPPAIMREGYTSILPSYLHTGPPVLLHPDRVVPHTESSRYERHFAPNVSLAPPAQKSKDEESDDEESTVKRSPQKSPEKFTSPSGKDYHEWDLPTESDDSSLGHRSPSDAEEYRHSESPRQPSTLEAELDMIRKALDGRVAPTKEAKDSFIREFSRLRIKHEELLNTTLQAKRTLKQQLQSSKSQSREKTKEGRDKSQRLDKETDRSRIESESQEDKDKHAKEIKILQNREEVETSKVLHINRDLQARLQHYEMAYEQLHCENTILREELHRLGINYAELLGKKCNGILPQTKSPPRSPRSPAGMVKNGHSGGHFVVAANRHEILLKKERDT